MKKLLNVKSHIPAQSEIHETAMGLLPKIRSLINLARQKTLTSANLSMVLLYWNIGQLVSTDIQNRPGRAEYGEELLRRLGNVLNEEYGQGFSERNLRDMRRFFESFVIRQTMPAEFPCWGRGRSQFDNIMLFYQRCTNRITVSPAFFNLYG